ncbi:hypothetical protein BCR33DRAFT_582059 [Rhizoclosmatium globosum]|uniref:Zn(2)-C6 fungal-type domain-containing protein n=1 Tax=Rhizoclosmatium globosum TaxID=329046 RepID=A0A1Y2CR20_9FUNG|nr:hypothetical protein BCR33DRAFT_582059 [Rhizoclosmatium globosum]|eukprot:ORY49407.1 hypothetical protein BCR33DRAFT_582059 [Rhizoclosmatium globosum]
MSTSPADHLQLFQPLRPPTISLRATSCDICRLQKKRCTKEKDGCQRCEAKGLKCEYSQLPIVNGCVIPRHSSRSLANDKHPS